MSKPELSEGFKDAITLPAIGLLGLALSLTACGAWSPPIQEEKPRFRQQTPIQTPRPGDVLSLDPPERIRRDRLFRRLGSGQVVYVGEQHDNPASHRVQYRILKNLHRSHGSLGVGFELFRQNQQDLLTSLSRGKITLNQLKTRLKRSAGGGKWVEYYREILLYARRHTLPLVALKPPREAVRRLRERVHGDTGNSTAFLTDPSPDDPQRRFLEQMFTEHVPTGRGFESFLAVQRFWESEMAANIASFLRDENQPDRILVLTGNYHVAYDFGIPDKLRQRGNWSQVSVVTLPVDQPLDDFFSFTRDNRSEGVTRADYVWWIQPKTSPPKHP